MSLLPNEQVRAGGVGIADDVLFFPLQSGTQWDALAHVSYRGQLYGGRPAASVTSAGTSVNDVTHVVSRVVTRGVLFDVARHRGVDSLKPGEAIESSELLEVAHANDVTIGQGDAVLVRTGYLRHCRERGWQGYSGASPGLGMSTLSWFADLAVAAVATDTYAVEVKPYQVANQASPFHVVALVYMGLLLGEIFDLDSLAASCSEDGCNEFMFVGAGLPVTGAVGTPVNPIAIK